MNEPDLFSQPPMEVAIRQRDTAMLVVQVNAGEEFSRKAREHIVAYLKANGSASGEDLTDSCKAADIVPHNDKAFGPVYMSLSRAGVIEKDMSTPPGPRRKGHCSGVAWRWKLKSQQP